MSYPFTEEERRCKFPPPLPPIVISRVTPMLPNIPALGQRRFEVHYGETALNAGFSVLKIFCQLKK